MKDTSRFYIWPRMVVNFYKGLALCSPTAHPIPQLVTSNGGLLKEKTEKEVRRCWKKELGSLFRGRKKNSE